MRVRVMAQISAGAHLRGGTLMGKEHEYGLHAHPVTSSPIANAVHCAAKPSLSAVAWHGVGSLVNAAALTFRFRKRGTGMAPRGLKMK